jgi:hypothetical protein
VTTLEEQIRKIEDELQVKEFLHELEVFGCAQDFIEWVKFILEKGGVPYYCYAGFVRLYIYEFTLPGQAKNKYITVKVFPEITERKHRDFKELNFSKRMCYFTGN